MTVVFSLISATHIHGAGLVTLGSLMLFHLAIAPVMFTELSGRAIWYLSTDLCVVFLIFLNVVATATPVASRKPWVLCHIANALALGVGGVLNLIAVRDPINILVLAAYIAVLAGALGRDQESFVRRAARALG